MPVTATGLADVGTGDAHPLVLSRPRQHAVQQLAVAGLKLGLLLQPAARTADPAGKRVTDRLELAEVEGARLTRDRGNAGVYLQARERVGEERAELRFEAPNLTPQLRPCETLVTIHAKRGMRLSFEQIRHSPTTSVDQGPATKAILRLSRRRADLSPPRRQIGPSAGG